MRIQPYRTMDNVIVGAVLTFVDVTEARQLQAALRESEEKYRALHTELTLTQPKNHPADKNNGEQRP
jgi:two-component system, chemotaxis family, CheB/CheR fusion protein